MTEEEQEGTLAAVSEQASVEPQDHSDEPKMVPLTALMGEKKRRKEAEEARIASDARARTLEEILAAKDQPEEKEDPEALLTKGSFQQEKALTKREILEQVYQDMNPEAVQKINTYLKPILDKKPWLASTIDNAVNRLSRANEIVNDYIHLVQEKPVVTPKASSDAKRIVENSQKPRSPTEIGKSAQPSGMEYLKSIQGKKEFREYRQKMLSGG